jgi:hypothetical protein
LSHISKLTCKRDKDWPFLRRVGGRIGSAQMFPKTPVEPVASSAGSAPVLIVALFGLFYDLA